ncbi:hypothetical protein [Polymorphospora rubra]|uniref:Uncharacterized protein n=1 Tax=Polymorphospora rubra TaxID=338584 RepID=A0A810MSN7_9ACTN|nr:hypothetical protein [Polymorphospora rubra]BCJ63664.1 hypothetical protein Prubr_06850 [Polymorphospora rubra]
MVDTSRIEPPACPRCGQTGRPVLIGLPDPEAFRAAEQGLLVLGGCVEEEDSPHWVCGAGHGWRGSDELLWAAISAAVDAG